MKNRTHRLSVKGGTSTSKCMHLNNNNRFVNSSLSHTPFCPPKQAACTDYLIKIKTKKARLLLECSMGHKVWGTPLQHTHAQTPVLHTHTNTQRVRKTTQLPPFSQSGNPKSRSKSPLPACCSSIKL